MKPESPGYYCVRSGSPDPEITTLGPGISAVLDHLPFCSSVCTVYSPDENRFVLHFVISVDYFQGVFGSLQQLERKMYSTNSRLMIKIKFLNSFWPTTEEAIPAFLGSYVFCTGFEGSESQRQTQHTSSRSYENGTTKPAPS